MRLSNFLIPVAACVLTGCMNHPDTTQEPGNRGTGAPLVTTPMAPNVDQSVNNANRSNPSPQNPGSSSPAGGDPQMSGH